MRRIWYILGLLLCALFVSCVPVGGGEPARDAGGPAGGTLESPAAIRTVQSSPTPAATAAEAAQQEDDFDFTIFEVHEKYFSEAGGYVELDLKLPKISGNYAGIAKINEFFIARQQFFYDELPFDSMRDAESAGAKVEGMQSGYYRSAYYALELRSGNILSVSALLDGGAGGVGWAGLEGDTFDLDTGKKLGLSDIFAVSEPAYMEFIYGFVSEKIMEEIDGSAESPYFFHDPYAEDGQGMIRGFNPDDFYLTDDALIIFYQKYALADGAAGPQAFEIPYESAADIWADGIAPTTR